MVANKVELNGEVLIDLTQDDVSENDVALGKRFHKADGQVGIGTFKPPQAKAEIKDNVLYITMEA